MKHVKQLRTAVVSKVTGLKAGVALSIMALSAGANAELPPAVTQMQADILAAVTDLETMAYLILAAVLLVTIIIKLIKRFTRAAI